jgi:hypothetical protein
MSKMMFAFRLTIATSGQRCVKRDVRIGRHRRLTDVKGLLMREHTMRYCLLALNLALVGMYFLPRETAEPGWLPPATEQELQTAHLQREHNLAACGLAVAGSESHVCAGACTNPQLIAGESASAHAYTSCDTPVGSATTPTGFGFDF